LKEESAPPPRTLKPDLYDVAPDELDTALRDFVTPAFRIRQIEEWLFDKGVRSFDEMSNLPLALRSELKERFDLDVPEIVRKSEPSPDGSQKYLFRLRDGALIESVYMPMGARTTFCLSSQAGCAVGCTFCVTGFYGAGRNLTAGEILGQVFALKRDNNLPFEQINLVFMGMGEPLLNLEHVSQALEILYRHIAPRRITISTSGIIPGLEELAALEHRPNLAISVNAPDQKRREEIMPITRKYPLGELVAALKRFPLEKGRELTAEYVLLAGFNDSVEDAHKLARLLRGLNVKVNAIPFNPDPNLPDWMKRPSDAQIDRFVSTLVRDDVQVTVRRSKGDTIAAACGQLRGQTEKRRNSVRR
jgi:23S rRNA (adenine2503-C2)-methyltransferase